MLIVSRTPLRVSLFGGGTDFADYFRDHGGTVLSLAIDWHVYVAIKPRWDDGLVVNHWTQERVKHVGKVRHGIVRECLRACGISHGFEVACMSDVPSGGSGLGASSALTVGLLNALRVYRGDTAEAGELASLASHIEIDVLGEPIGKQDQHAAAFGGCREYHFNTDDSVTVERVALAPECEQELRRHSLLFYTGRTRKAAHILKDQRTNIRHRIEQLHELKANVAIGRKLLEQGDMRELGSLLHQSWLQKKSLSDKIHDMEINRLYDRARAAGAYGGKLLGAGGGGFFLFLCPPERQPTLRDALTGLREFPLRIDQVGTSILLNSSA